MTQIAVKDANGATQNLEVPNANGQQLMAASRPVVIASNQSAIPVNSTIVAAIPAGANVIGGVTQSGTWNITNISGTISLPTGAATSANQSTLNTAIGSISDAVVANGVAGSLASYLRTIKDQVTDTSTPSPVKIDQTTPGTTNATALSHIASTAVAVNNGTASAGCQRVVIASDQTPFGVQVQTPADVISFTPTLDTSIYAANDVLFATTAITGVTRANDGRANLVSITGIDKSKQNPAITLLFYQTNVTSAAANAANALSDADQANLLGTVDIPAASWKTWANNSTICLSGATAPNLLLEAASGTTTVYVVGILTAGTPTFANGDLVFKFGVVQS